MTLVLGKLPLFGPFWTWAASDPARLPWVAISLFAATVVLLGICWTEEEVTYSTSDFMFFREPTLGLTGNQIRGLLTFPLLLPLTFHLAPLLLAMMLLYHLAGASVYLGKMAVGIQPDK